MMLTAGHQFQSPCLYYTNVGPNLRGEHLTAVVTCTAFIGFVFMLRDGTNPDLVLGQGQGLYLLQFPQVI